MQLCFETASVHVCTMLRFCDPLKRCMCAIRISNWVCFLFWGRVTLAASLLCLQALTLRYGKGAVGGPTAGLCRPYVEPHTCTYIPMCPPFRLTSQTCCSTCPSSHQAVRLSLGPDRCPYSGGMMREMVHLECWTRYVCSCHHV